MEEQDEQFSGNELDEPEDETNKSIPKQEPIEEAEKKDPKKEGVDKFTYLDISSINNITGKIANPKICQGYKAPSRARQVVKANDILFSTVRHYLKNIAVVDEIYNDQIASTGFCVMRCCGIINSRLLFRFVSSDVFIDRLNGFQRGISYPAVKTSDLLDQPIPLPPFSEQKEIITEIAVHPKGSISFTSIMSGMILP